MTIFSHFEGSDDEFKDSEDYYFNKAKKLSDYLGMMVILGFLGTSITVLVNVINSINESYFSELYIFSAIALLVIAFIHYFNIQMVTFLYVFRYARKFSNSFLKHAIVLILMISSSIFLMGILRISINFAKLISP